jgi:dTDP-4-amino-4,6-dideoxy-D-galactose acyltransferase
VGKFKGLIENEQDLRSIELLIEKQNTKLSYYATPNKLPANLLESKNLNIVLVDKKTTYVKNINPNLKIHTSISTIDKKTTKIDRLINLSIQSGIYSRFNVDKNIGKDKFEKMYTLWIKNSISRTKAKEVLAFSANNESAGFVTLGESHARADIGIIAVDHNYRGKGIGKALMSSAEKWSSDIGHNVIQVVTQGDNIPACRLYESCGYKLEKLEFFYHIWKK